MFDREDVIIFGLFVILMGLMLGFVSCENIRKIDARETTKQFELQLKIEQAKQVSARVSANQESN